ncbi:cation-transporting P-type ATPase 13A2 [Nematocida ausubeli]|nr:cation-transporting P-type ATPase 13A2 [Nematocida ausubeli]
MPAFIRGQNKSGIQGRKRRFPKEIYYGVSLMTLGLFHVLCSSAAVKLLIETKQVSVEDADILIFNGKAFEVLEEEVEEDEITYLVRDYIKNGKYRYVFINSTRLIFNWKYCEYYTPKGAKYMDTLTRKEREILFGKNMLVTKSKSNFYIFFDALFDKINVYTIFGILLWIYIDYYIYAFLIFLLMAYNLTNEVSTEVQKNAQSEKISKVQKHSFILWNGAIKVIKEAEIVLGDILVLLPFTEVPCDCVVISGSVAVNEGFVTGESVPVLKKENTEVLAGSVVFQAIMQDPEKYEHKDPTPEIEKYLESNNYCLVRAVRISYDSARGKAFRNLIEDKMAVPPIYYDTIKFIGIIACMLIPCVFSVFIYLQAHLPTKILICYIFDLVYALVSPSLPTAIWVGMSMCAQRLQQKKIVCKDISISNVSGTITKVCFDKTGTLTEEGLDIKCINVDGTEVFSIEDIKDPIVLRGLSMCHSVEKIGDRLIGDPLDVKLLQFAKGCVDYTTRNQKIEKTVAVNGKVLGKINETFDFDSTIRRMSTVSEANDGSLYAFAKGSAEAILSISENQAGSDEDRDVVSEYTREGYRVISLAGKPMKERTKDRQEVESNLKILCTIVFENKLKKDSAKTIDTLKRAGLSSIMCTGDALLTAVSVAMNCEIIEPHVPVIYPKLGSTKKTIESVVWACFNDDVVFDKMLMKVKKGQDYVSYIDYVIAIEGTLFDLFMEHPEYKQLIQRRCKVFSRMNPLQKSKVVGMYKETDLVCFVGDGANDCNAIQIADVGISISNSEGSVEYCVSSYLSYTKEISCILDIIKEGKCAIITTLSKIEQILIITISQFNALIILLFKKLFMSDMQNIYTDILINIPLSILMSHFKASKKLSKKKPQKRLLAQNPIAGIVVHCFTHLIHLLMLFKYLEHLGHVNVMPSKPNKLSEESQLATGIFLMSNLQALYSGLVYTPGAPFRENKNANKLFIAFYLFHLVLLSILFISVSSIPVSDNSMCVMFRKLFNLLPLSLNATIAILALTVSDAFIVILLTKVLNALHSS